MLASNLPENDGKIPYPFDTFVQYGQQPLLQWIRVKCLSSSQKCLQGLPAAGAGL